MSTDTGAQRKFKAICKRCGKVTIADAYDPFSGSDELKKLGVVFSGGNSFCGWRHKKKFDKGVPYYA